MYHLDTSPLYKAYVTHLCIASTYQIYVSYIYIYISHGYIRISVKVLCWAKFIVFLQRSLTPHSDGSFTLDALLSCRKLRFPIRTSSKHSSTTKSDTYEKHIHTFDNICSRPIQTSPLQAPPQNQTIQSLDPFFASTPQGAPRSLAKVRQKFLGACARQEVLPHVLETAVRIHAERRPTRAHDKGG